MSPVGRKVGRGRRFFEDLCEGAMGAWSVGKAEVKPINRGSQGIRLSSLGREIIKLQIFGVLRDKKWSPFRGPEIAVLSSYSLSGSTPSPNPHRLSHGAPPRCSFLLAERFIIQRGLSSFTTTPPLALFGSGRAGEKPHTLVKEHRHFRVSAKSLFQLWLWTSILTRASVPSSVRWAPLCQLYMTIGDIRWNYSHKYMIK